MLLAKVSGWPGLGPGVGSGDVCSRVSSVGTAEGAL